MSHSLSNGLRTLAAVVGRSSRLAGPRTVALILSRTCNSQCLMCWYHSPLRPPAESETDPVFMDSGLAETLLEQCRSLGVFRVVLGGHGEPTLHPGFDRLLDRADRLGLEAYVISNGLDIDPARAGRWSRRRAHFRFSLHAADARTWAKIHPHRGQDDFAAVEKTVGEVARGRRSKVSILHVIQRANAGRLGDTLDQAARLGVREVLFMPVRADGPRESVLLRQEDRASLCDELEQCARRAAHLRIRTNLRELLETSSFTHDGVPRTPELYSQIPCVIGHLYLEVDIDGTVRPCEGSRIVLGSAADCADLRELWRSPEYEVFRRRGRRLPRSSEPIPGCPCGQCTMAPFNLAVARLLRPGRLRIGHV